MSTRMLSVEELTAYPALAAWVEREESLVHGDESLRAAMNEITADYWHRVRLALVRAVVDDVERRITEALADFARRLDDMRRADAAEYRTLLDALRQEVQR